MNYRNPLLVLASSAGLLLGSMGVLGLMANEIQGSLSDGRLAYLLLDALLIMLPGGLLAGYGTVLLARGVWLLWFEDAHKKTPSRKPGKGLKDRHKPYC